MSSAWRYLVSTDHKAIAKKYLWSGLVFLALGGALAMVMRWQWAYPGQPVPLVGGLLFPGSDGAVTPASYTSLFTNHGLVMIFFAITPILIGCFGNFCVPLLIGAREMALPRVNAAAFWVFALSQGLALASMVMPQGAAASGWTMYPPLSATIAEPGPGQTVMIAAIFATGIATILGAVNLVTTVILCRAPGMTWTRLPLTVWGLWLTSLLSALFVPVLAAASVLLFLDRVAGTSFFIAGAAGTGDPLLYQHLFWIFGHPEVYILILPVWGILGDLLAMFSRKPAFWYRGSVAAMCTVAGMSGLVYGHHMFQAGIGPMLGTAFEALTLAISAPAVVLYVNWLCTLWRGSIRLTVPMLFCLGTMLVFGGGGLTGLYLGAITTDIHLHDSLWVVGHFHMIMAAATFLGSFAAIYYWFPKMFGRHLSRRLGLIHFGGSLVCLVVTFSLMLAAGYAGQPRRLYDPFQYEFVADLAGVNTVTSYAAFLLGAFQLVFVVNFVYSLGRGPRAEANPWEATTLEWTVPSPPPQENFAQIPTVRRGPHELAHPNARARLGRDYLDQVEEAP
jgi:cytochrome c oxidase subunit I